MFVECRRCVFETEIGEAQSRLQAEVGPEGQATSRFERKAIAIEILSRFGSQPGS